MTDLKADGIKLTDGDMKLLRTAALKMNLKIEGDWQEFSKAMGHAHPNSTRVCWNALLRKLKPKDGIETPKSTPKSTPKRKRKAGEADEAGEDEAGEEGGISAPASKRERKPSKKAVESDEIREEQADD